MGVGGSVCPVTGDFCNGCSAGQAGMDREGGPLSYGVSISGSPFGQTDDGGCNRAEIGMANDDQSSAGGRAGLCSYGPLLNAVDPETCIRW